MLSSVVVFVESRVKTMSLYLDYLPSSQQVLKSGIQFNNLNELYSTQLIVKPFIKNNIKVRIKK